MGSVAVLFRLMPEGVETDLQAVGTAVRGAVPATATLRGMQVKDIAYGLKALLVSVVMPDTEGILGEVESALGKIPHVASVEVMEEGLV